MRTKLGARRRFAPGIAAALISLAMPAPALAYCIGADTSLPGYRPDYYSIEQEFLRARYVATVRVVGETWLGDDGQPKALKPPFQLGRARPFGFDPYIGVFYDVEVLTPFKGQPPRRLRLFSENSTARAEMTVGQSYLAFIGDDGFEWLGGRHALFIDNCGNSARLAKAAGALRKVRALAGP